MTKQEQRQKEREGKRWAIQNIDRENKQWAGRDRARNRMIETIVRGEEEIKWLETKWEGKEVLLERLVTAEPTHALFPSPRANWHLQCENSSLCSHCHRHTPHKHTHLQGVRKAFSKNLTSYTVMHDRENNRQDCVKDSVFWDFLLNWRLDAITNL